MTSQSIRDTAKDHLLTPQNSALVIIDYQPVQVTSVASMDRRMLVNNIVPGGKLGEPVYAARCAFDCSERDEFVQTDSTNEALTATCAARHARFLASPEADTQTQPDWQRSISWTN